MDDLLRTVSSSGVTTTHLCDACSSIRVINFLKPIVQKEFRGIAHVVNAMGDIIPVWKAIDTAEEGSVLVIDSNRSKNALIGEFLTQFAQSKKIAAIVLFGFCRDTDAISELGLPFFSMGACPKAGTKNQLGEIGGAITVDGVTIKEGDYIIGDGDGMVIMSQDELNSVLPRALTILEKEKNGLKRIEKEGASVSDVFNFREHYEKLVANEKSELALF